MRLSVNQVATGLHPNEVVVAVETQSGSQHLVINQRSLDQAGTIDVGEPVGKREGYFLIELPAETSSGAWRVWVSRELVRMSEAHEAAE
jgi:hypothetical protein